MDHLIGSRKIYLIGMMGSGKTYWAGKLGHYYSLPAFDLDRLIETAAGKTIRQLFEEEGETAFREIESAMLKAGVPGNKYVLACGGGTPCFHGNMEFMKKSGTVVWLNPPLDELVKRVSRAIDSRPVLEGHKSPEALKEHLKNLMMTRETWYQQAHIEITGDATIRDITTKISQPGNTY